MATATPGSSSKQQHHVILRHNAYVLAARVPVLARLRQAVPMQKVVRGTREACP